MRRTLLFLVSSFMAFVAPRVVAESKVEADKQWGQWRGPLFNGVAPHAQPPTEWGDEKNIRWKVDLPGDGHSTPIIWGDRVYVQVAISENDAPKKEGEGKPAEGDGERRRERGPDGERRRDGERGERRERPDDPPSGEPRGDGPQRGDGPPREGRGGPGGPGGPRGRQLEPPADTYNFVILAYDRKTGKEVWRNVVRKEKPHEGSHTDGSLAPASPFTDGTNLFAYFGSRGLYAFDMDGKLLWEKDFGNMKTRNGFGEGTTPVLHKDTIVIPWDHEEDGFIVALDKTTGNEKWRKPRSEATTWATPLVIESKGQEQVIMPATKRVRSYDLRSGDVIWECGGLGANAIPTPVAAFGLVYAMTGFREGMLLAIKYEGAKGDITDSAAVAWKTDKGTPYVPSPLLYDDKLYYLQKNSQILSCMNAKTGEPHYEQQRLEEINGVYSSPIGADGRVYVLGRDGTTYVIKHGPKFEVLATNKLSDDFSASPAAVDKELFVRGRKHLYCIAAN